MYVHRTPYDLGFAEATAGAKAAAGSAVGIWACAEAGAAHSEILKSQFAVGSTINDISQMLYHKC